MYNALLKIPLSKPLVNRGTQHMGIYRTSELVDENLNKTRFKKGVNGN